MAVFEVSIDGFKSNFLVGLQASRVSHGDLGDEGVELCAIELAMAVVEGADDTLAAPGFGNTDLAHEVEALFAERPAFEVER